MFGSTIIETALALTLVYLLLSLLCSGINEVVLGHFRALRSKLLESFLQRLLGSGGEGKDSEAQFANRVLNHPLVMGLKPADRARPSYIPPLTFVSAVLDELLSPQTLTNKNPGTDPARGTQNPARADDVAATLIGDLDILDLQEAIRRQPDERVRKLFSSLLLDAGSMTEARQRLEHWFNDSMDRLTGMYKRKAQFWLHVLALLVVFVLNIDTIEISRQFMANTAQRAAFVAAAEDTARNGLPSTPTNSVQLAELSRQIKDLNLPIGWGRCWWGTNSLTHALGSDWSMSAPPCPSDFQSWLLKIAGLLLSATAVSLGAPFWFDLLNRITNLRAGGRPPKTEPDKKKE